jgi:hypothetical protein
MERRTFLALVPGSLLAPPLAATEMPRGSSRAPRIQIDGTFYDRVR